MKADTTEYDLRQRAVTAEIREKRAWLIVSEVCEYVKDTYPRMDRFWIEQRIGPMCRDEMPLHRGLVWSWVVVGLIAGAVGFAIARLL